MNMLSVNTQDLKLQVVDDNFMLGKESFSVSNLNVKTYFVFFFNF